VRLELYQFRLVGHMKYVLSALTDVRFSGFVRDQFSRQGYKVQHSGNVAQTFSYLDNDKFDLVICSQRLADGDAMDVIDRLKSGRSEIPVMVVADTNDKTNVIQTLKNGADDCVSAPLSVEEVVVRSEKLMQRQKLPEYPIVTIKGLAFNADTNEVWWGDKSLVLRKKEFEVYFYIARRSPALVSYEMFLDNVWPLEQSPTCSTLAVYVRRLRMRLATQAFPTVKTVRGSGYALNFERGNVPDLQTRRTIRATDLEQ
jgi:two-component system OmpR family response regulator